MYYVITDNPELKSIEDCTYFLAVNYPTVKKDLKDDIISDLIFFNVFYNHKSPQLNIYTDCEFNNKYKFISNSIRYCKAGETINKYYEENENRNYIIKKESRCLTNDEIENMVNNIIKLRKGKVHKNGK